MKDDTPDNLPENGFTSSGSSDSITDLVSFAREHFASDFPNPERNACPAPQTFSDLIDGKELPSDELQQHLQSCSQCFRLYGSELQAQRETVLLKPVWRPAPWYRRALTVGLPLLLICVAGVAVYKLYQMKRQGSEQTSASSKPQSPIQHDETNSTTRNAVAERKQTSPVPVASPARIAAAAYAVTLNFGSQRVSRGDSQRGSSPVVLLARLNRITARLNPESPKGEYGLTLNDPFGKEIRPPVTATFDGRSLHADLDLHSIEPGEYLICISRTTELPDCLPARVKRQ